MKRGAVVVEESSLVFPEVSMGKSKKECPSFTDEELWEFVGERGVHCYNPRYFKYCFREIVHRDGYILYRMKPCTEYENVIVRAENGRKIQLFYDPMEVFHSRFHFMSDDERDNLVIAQTHAKPFAEPEDVIETWCDVPFDEFSKYLDKAVPMDDFEQSVQAYLNKKWSSLIKKSKTEV